MPGSAAITGYRGFDGSGALSIVTSGGLAPSTDPSSGRYGREVSTTASCHVVSNNGGAINEFAIRSDGSLSPISSITGLPTSISGALTR